MCKNCDDNGCTGCLNRFNSNELPKLPEGDRAAIATGSLPEICYIEGCMSRETKLLDGRGEKKYPVCQKHTFFHCMKKSFVKIYKFKLYKKV
jgi:hypothetical protein